MNAPSTAAGDDGTLPLCLSPRLGMGLLISAVSLIAMAEAARRDRRRRDRSRSPDVRPGDLNSSGDDYDDSDSFDSDVRVRLMWYV